MTPSSSRAEHTRGCAAREVAWHALYALENAAYHGQLTSYLDAAGGHTLSARDYAFAHTLCLTYLRNKTLLEHEITHVAHRSCDTLDAPLRLLVALTLAELAFLQRTKPHATVHTMVSVCRRARKKSWSGFLNAVARQWLREERHATLGDDVREDIACVYSHPAWLVDTLRVHLSEEQVRATCVWNNNMPRHYARLRVPYETLCDMSDITPVPVFGDDVVEIHDLTAVLASPAFARGDLYVQSPWSIDVTRHLPLHDGQRILDLCAAPGGKALAVADKAHVTVLAADASHERMNTLYANCHRCCATRVFPLKMDAVRAQYLLGEAQCDVIVLDAPCTSLGVIQRHPAVRWRVTPEDIRVCADRQKKMLDAALRCVRPGGAVLYAVCTYTHEETTDVVAHACRHAHIRCEEEKRRLPGEDGYDGGYYARLRRLS